MRFTTEQVDIISDIVDNTMNIDPKNDDDNQLFLRNSIYLMGMIDGFLSENQIIDSQNIVEEKTILEDFDV